MPPDDRDAHRSLYQSRESVDVKIEDAESAEKYFDNWRELERNTKS